MKQTSPPTQEHSSVEHIAEVFGQCREEIIDEWRLQAGELLRALKLDRATLTDHVPDIVKEIIDDLTHRREGAPMEQMQGTKTHHGAQRVTDGLDVGEVVAEFNLLRMAFFTVMDRHGLYLVGEAARILSRRIDDSVREAVTAFAERQARNLKAKEDEHLAFVAHDLQTPLNAASLAVAELRESLDPPASGDTGELFEILTRNLVRARDLIRKVLDANIPSTGAGSSFRPERRTFELWPLVQRLVFDLRSISSNQGIQVVNEVPRTLTVFADAGLVSQVFQNLLDNAFNYAARGRVVVSASESEEAVTCVVRDNGSGIPSDMLARVFDKLATDPDKTGGTGLGLAIVKQIVEAHGGTVSVESTPEEGTTFAFTIPAQREG